MTEIIAFNGTTHKTKRAATEALREVVAALPFSTWLRPGDPNFDLLLTAFAQHPTWGTLASGIAKLRTERERGGGLAIAVVMQDGTRDKVGWTRCFTTARTNHSRVMAALRNEIAPQIQYFRKLVERGTIPQVSALSGAPLVMSGSRRFHVDHTPAFADTVEEWAPRWGGLDSIEVHDLLGGGTEIVDTDIADDWWNFHLEHHNHERGLRALTREENLALGRHNGEV